MSEGKPMILIVEDDPTLAAYYQRHILKELDPDIQHVRTMSAGLQEARRSSPDVVVLDLGLPDCGPSQSVSLIPEFHPASVVVVTGHDDREAECYLAGASRVCPKPARPADVVRAVALELDPMWDMRQLDEARREIATARNLLELMHG